MICVRDTYGTDTLLSFLVELKNVISGQSLNLEGMEQIHKDADQKVI